MNDRYIEFIKEQESYFKTELSHDFNSSWLENNWRGGLKGSGWLKCRGKNVSFNFEQIKRAKGLPSLRVNHEYQLFLKSMMVLSFRKSNRRASVSKLYAEFLVLRRWYASLHKYQLSHPIEISTLIIKDSFEILKKNSHLSNLGNFAGTYIRLQSLINHYGFTQRLLEFDEKYIYINKSHRTKKAHQTLMSLNQSKLDDDELNADKLISIKTFINIISLIGLCRTDGEKIILNLVLLLIVTGFRSTEAFFLELDALIEKPILDIETQEHLCIDGIKQYTVGIKYYGAKGAGHRIHWLEPSTVPLIKSIFDSVKNLTQEAREHVLYIRKKNNEHITDFLPKTVDDIPGEYLEIDDFINTVIGVKQHYPNPGGQREAVSKWIQKTQLEVKKEVKEAGSSKKLRYFSKADINDLIRNTAKFDIPKPMHIEFKIEGEIKSIPLESLLFIHFFRSSTLSRSLYNKGNVVPLDNRIVNAFLGNSKSVSAFKKYELKENDSHYSKMTTHVPRHNINTFLALSGLSEHLQAMLMGRVDITQNQYYQHLALKQRRVAAGIKKKIDTKRNTTVNNPIENESTFNNGSTALTNAQKNELESKFPTNLPLDSIKKDGFMMFSKTQTFENNIKRNFHSFDNKQELSKYIHQSSSFFEDIADSFNELSKESKSNAMEMVERQAYLHPLRFGACMRNVGLHDCPVRLACLSGMPCGNFTLTGSKGELERIQLQKTKLKNEFSEVKKNISDDIGYFEMLLMLEEQIANLEKIENSSRLMNDKMTEFIVFPYNNLGSLPNTLSELFAMEQLKIENKGNEDA